MDWAQQQYRVAQEKQQVQDALGLMGPAATPGAMQQKAQQPGQPQAQQPNGQPINVSLDLAGMPAQQPNQALGDLGARYGMGPQGGNPLAAMGQQAGQMMPQRPMGAPMGQPAPQGPAPGFAHGGMVQGYAQGGEIEQMPSPVEMYKIYLARRQARGYARGGRVSLAVRRK